MTARHIAFTLVSALLLNFTAFATKDTKPRRKAPAAAGLASLLPASDAVVTMDSDGLFSQALPQILTANEKLFTEMMSKVDEVRQMTGIDLRQFDEVAVGVKAVAVRPNETEYQPLILARGKFSSDALVAIVAVAGAGKYREEKVGERTVYIFSPSEVAAKNRPKGGSVMDNVLGAVIDGLDREMALTAYDSGTLAVGATLRIRELLDGGSRIDAGMLGAVARRNGEVMNLAMRTRNGMEQFIKLDDDTLGKSLSGIRMITGSMGVGAAGASMSLSATTANAEQAAGLKSTLDGLKMFLPALLGGGKGKNQTYGRLVDSLRLTRVGSQVSLSLTIPQSDINVLVGE